MSVLRDIQGAIIVEEAQCITPRRAVDDGCRNDLVHSFVVLGARRVVDEACAAAVDCAGEEGHAEGFVVRDALERADEVGALEVLGWLACV